MALMARKPTWRWSWTRANSHKDGSQLERARVRVGSGPDGIATRVGELIFPSIPEDPK